MSIWKQVKDAFRRYLDRLGKENEELFGGGQPDCCALNRKQAAQKPRKQG